MNSNLMETTKHTEYTKGLFFKRLVNYILVCLVYLVVKNIKWITTGWSGRVRAAQPGHYPVFLCESELQSTD